MLAYVDVIERKDTITIDGYTSNKTEKGIVKDVARAVRKYSESEADCLLETIKCGETPFLNATDSCGGYFFEYEETHCAAKYNEDTEQIEYKDGFNNYFCIRIVK